MRGGLGDGGDGKGKGMLGDGQMSGWRGSGFWSGMDRMHMYGEMILLTSYIPSWKCFVSALLFHAPSLLRRSGSCQLWFYHKRRPRVGR